MKRTVKPIKICHPDSDWVFIYGLYNTNRNCLYVGQTVHIPDRSKAHKWAGKKFAKIKVLKKCRAVNASAIEMRLVRKFKSLGQCKLNKSRAESNLVAAKTCTGIYIQSLNKAFYSKSQAARALGISGTRLTQKMKQGQRIYQCSIL